MTVHGTLLVGELFDLYGLFSHKFLKIFHLLEMILSDNAVSSEGRGKR